VNVIKERIKQYFEGLPCCLKNTFTFTSFYAFYFDFLYLRICSFHSKKRGATVDNLRASQPQSICFIRGF